MESKSNNIITYCPKCGGHLHSQHICFRCGFDTKESDKEVKVVPAYKQESNHPKRWYDKKWFLAGLSMGTSGDKFEDTPKEEFLNFLYWGVIPAALLILLIVLIEFMD